MDETAHHFVAIDVETANADRASICQVGVAQFEGGRVACEWKTLVDPDDDFDPLNVSIHGIDENVVKGAPTFEMIASELAGRLAGRIAVSHTGFDRVAIERAYEAIGLPAPRCTWLDSARVARRTWEDVAKRGYGLGPLCQRIGYSYQAHDALEDAKAAAMVLLAAMHESKTDVAGWVDLLSRPRPSNHTHTSPKIAAAGNPDGPLFGEVVVFTGALCIPRREAAELASRIGCEVAPGVTKRTTMVVIGYQDARHLNGHEKSTKHARAESLIAAGQHIEVLTEKDFERLVQHFVATETAA
jgi:DNA polymerase-3 subunit epsilon